MPKGKGDKKKKKEKKPKMIGNETLDVIVKRLMKSYEKNCGEMKTTASTKLLTMMRNSIENIALLENFIITWNEKMVPGDPPITLEPLLVSLRKERYRYLKDLRMWNIPVDHTNAASLAILIEKGLVPFRRIEMMDCLLSEEAVTRLSLSFPVCETLTHLCFDYNEFGDKGCQGLCQGLEDTKTVISVSLNYCGLGASSGKPLGRILATTTVRELFLDGNDLECEGALALIGQCSVAAEIETTEKLNEQREKAEAAEIASKMEKENRYNKAFSEGDAMSADERKPEEIKEEKADGKKKKKGKKKKGKTPPPPPTPGPSIHKLHLADNGIDGLKGQSLLTKNENEENKKKTEHYPEENESQMNQDSLTFLVQEVTRLITYSETLEELDLEDNLIGDLGGYRILSALTKREENGLPAIKVRTTHRMNPDTFNEIVKLASGLNKKKKKKKGKKK